MLQTTKDRQSCRPQACKGTSNPAPGVCSQFKNATAHQEGAETNPEAAAAEESRHCRGARPGDGGLSRKRGCCMTPRNLPCLCLLYPLVFSPLWYILLSKLPRLCSPWFVAGALSLVITVQYCSIYKQWCCAVQHVRIQCVGSPRFRALYEILLRLRAGSGCDPDCCLPPYRESKANYAVKGPPHDLWCCTTTMQ